MSVAVVIVTYNNLVSTLNTCLSSLAQQTLPAARTIVIDNAGPAGFPHGILDAHRNVELIRNRENIGFAAANNQALRILDDDRAIELVALLNPDTQPEPTWLGELVEASRRYPDFDAFASRMMLAGTQDVVDGLGDAYHVSGLAWRMAHGMRLRPSHLLEREVFGVCAGAGLYRLDALRKVGGFDAELFCYLEDVDLSFRMRRTGRRCRYVPGAVVWHAGGESSRDNIAFRLYHGHRNMIRVYLKNMPTALLLLTLPAHLAVNVFGIVRSFWRGESAIVLRAKYDALRAVGRVVAQRRELNRIAIAGSKQIWRHLSKALIRDVAPAMAVGRRFQEVPRP